MTRARGLLGEIIDAASEQGWTWRQKDEGILFFPPARLARVDTRSGIYARDPGNDSKTQRVLRARFSKAGMKFDNDQPQRQQRMTAAGPGLITSTPPPAPPSEPGLEEIFTQINKKVDQCVTTLGEIDELVRAARAKTGDLQRLRALLKAL